MLVRFIVQTYYDEITWRRNGCWLLIFVFDKACQINMVIKYEDILKIITVLGDDENLRITVKQSAKGGLIAGFSCAVGGLIAGPPGLAVGGAVGGCLAAYVTSDSFKPLSTVILYEMKPIDQNALVQAVTNITQNIDAMDALELLAIIQGSNALKAKILSEVTTYCQRQLNTEVISN